MAEKPRVYVSFVSHEDQMSRQVYICRREVWDRMSHGEKAIEMIDRLTEDGVQIVAEDDNGDEIEIEETEGE